MSHTSGQFTVNSTQDKVRSFLVEDLIRGWLDRYIWSLPRTQAEYLFNIKIQCAYEKGTPANYNEYMQSSRWRELRSNVLRSFDNKCVACGSTEDVHIHHRNYENFGNETFSDLVLLCKMCHFFVHPDAHMTKQAFIEENTWLLWLLFESVKMGDSIFQVSVKDDEAIENDLVPRYIAACNKLPEPHKSDQDATKVTEFMRELVKEFGFYGVSTQMQGFERRLADTQSAVIESPKAYLRSMCRK